nr:carbohydrate kinase family protein [Micromonospora sp. DSM 115978]
MTRPDTSAPGAAATTDDQTTPHIVAIGSLTTDYMIRPPGGDGTASLTEQLARLITAVNAGRIDLATLHTAVKDMANRGTDHPKLGGAAFTTAIAAACCRRGLRIGYVGVAGRTFAPPTHLQQLTALGIDHQFLFADRNRQPCGLRVTIDHDATTTHFAVPGANQYLGDHLTRHHEALTAYLAAARLVHITPILDTRSTQHLLAILRTARHRNPNLLISVDPGPEWSTRTDRAVVGIRDLSSHLLLTRPQLRALGGATDATDATIATRLLRRMGNGTAIILRNPSSTRIYRHRDGALLTETRSQVRLPASTAGEVGAGDAFAAGLLTVLARDPTQIRLAVALGVRLARHALHHPGTAPAQYATLTNDVLTPPTHVPHLTSGRT